MRPTTCRYYPLAFNPDNVFFPTIDSSCNGILRELEKQFPSIKKGDVLWINDFDLVNAFPTEFLIYQTITEYLVSVIGLIMRDLGFLKRIKKIKLRLFSCIYHFPVSIIGLPVIK